VKHLLATQEILAEGVTNDGFNVFHLAACGSSLAIFVSLLASSVARTCINTADHRGYTPLHLLASQGNLDMLEHALYLLDLKATTKLGQTCLHLAVSHPQSLFLLLKSGVDDIPDQSGRLALHVAAVLGFTESVKHLVKAAPSNVDLVSQDGASALILACKHKQAAVVSELLKVNSFSFCVCLCFLVLFCL
jgi:ankyrin repeat protein